MEVSIEGKNVVLIDDILFLKDEKHLMFSLVLLF